jgi:hypothetical protein
MKQLESVDIYLAQTPKESGLFQATVVTAKASAEGDRCQEDAGVSPSRPQ